MHKGYIDGRRVTGFRLRGTVALNGVNLAITDISTPSSGYCRGLYINFTNTGAKTGSAELNPLAIDVDSSANVPHIFTISIYIGALSGATVNHAAGIYMYIDSTSGTLARKHGLWIQMVGTGATKAHFLSVQHMGGTITSIINSQSVGNCATYLLHMEGEHYPPPAGEKRPFYMGDLTDTGGSSVACDGYLKIRVGGTDLYIPVYDTKA